MVGRERHVVWQGFLPDGCSGDEGLRKNWLEVDCFVFFALFSLFSSFLLCLVSFPIWHSLNHGDSAARASYVFVPLPLKIVLGHAFLLPYSGLHVVCYQYVVPLVGVFINSGVSSVSINSAYELIIIILVIIY